MSPVRTRQLLAFESWPLPSAALNGVVPVEARPWHASGIGSCATASVAIGRIPASSPVVWLAPATVITALIPRAGAPGAGVPVDAKSLSPPLVGGKTNAPGAVTRTVNAAVGDVGERVRAARRASWSSPRRCPPATPAARPSHRSAAPRPVPRVPSRFVSAHTTPAIRLPGPATTTAPPTSTNAMNTTTTGTMVTIRRVIVGTTRRNVKRSSERRCRAPPTATSNASRSASSHQRAVAPGVSFPSNVSRSCPLSPCQFTNRRRASPTSHDPAPDRRQAEAWRRPAWGLPDLPASAESPRFEGSPHHPVPPCPREPPPAGSAHAVTGGGVRRLVGGHPGSDRGCGRAERSAFTRRTLVATGGPWRRGGVRRG